MNNLAERLDMDEVQDEPRRVLLTVAPRPEEADEDLADLARRLAPRRLTDQEVEAILAAAAPASEDVAGAAKADPSAAPQPTAGFPWSKAALFASLTFIVLLAAAYLHLHAGVERLTDELQNLAAIKGQVTRLDTKMGILETKVADLETLPAKTRAALLASILQELAQKTEYLAGQVGSAEQQDKLERAKELVQQVQTELGAVAAH